MIPVIICGGVGSKMWPLSTPSLPKHFLPFINGKSLFQANWETLRQKFKPEEIYIQTNARQAEIARSQIEEILPENIFIEPETRNHGPATGLAAAFLTKIGKGNEPFMLIQADDLRLPEKDFLDFMKVAEDMALSTGKYVTAGYEPDRVVLGVDYLLTGKLISGNSPIQVYEIDDYVAREETDKINKYMNSGRLLVHTNHTTMTPLGLLDMYKRYKPEWHTPLTKIIDGAEVAEEYAKMPKGPLEEVSIQSHKEGRSLVIKIPFKWIDFGTWEFVDKYYRDNEMRAQNGGEIQLEGENNFLWSESGKIMATIGVSNLVIVESKNGVLVTKKELSGEVGQIAERVKAGDYR